MQCGNDEEVLRMVVKCELWTVVILNWEVQYWRLGRFCVVCSVCEMDMLVWCCV